MLPGIGSNVGITGVWESCWYWYDW